jgi:hypothetical protein
MVTDLFIDGAGEVGVQGTVIRINLQTSSATEKDASGQPVKEVRQRLIMTAQGAAELHSRLEAALRRLAEAGLVSRKQPAGEEV